jgi:short-subunit dehydrogenase
LTSATKSRSPALTSRFVDLDLRHTFASGVANAHVANSATTPEIVARSALAGLGRRMTVVPGFRGKFLTAALAMLPRRLRIRVLALVIRGMRKPTSAQPAD